MIPDVKRRFEALEERRRKLVDRVLALPPDQQSAQPTRKSFSPAQMLMHMALTEDFYIGFLVRNPPETLRGKPIRHGGMYNRLIKDAEAATERFGTFPSLKPPSHVTVIEGARKWETIRSQLRTYLDEAEGMDEPFIKFMFFIGLLSTGDFLRLMEAHMHYHEVLFPGIKEK